MTDEELKVITGILTDILSELRKANERPLYIVVNNEKALKDFVDQFYSRRTYEDNIAYYEQEKARIAKLNEDVAKDKLHFKVVKFDGMDREPRYMLVDQHYRTWLNGKPFGLTTNAIENWHEFPKTEVGAWAQAPSDVEWERQEGDIDKAPNPPPNVFGDLTPEQRYELHCGIVMLTTIPHLAGTPYAVKGYGDSNTGEERWLPSQKALDDWQRMRVAGYSIGRDGGIKTEETLYYESIHRGNNND